MATGPLKSTSHNAPPWVRRNRGSNNPSGSDRIESQSALTSETSLGNRDARGRGGGRRTRGGHRGGHSAQASSHAAAADGNVRSTGLNNAASDAQSDNASGGAGPLVGGGNRNPKRRHPSKRPEGGDSANSNTPASTSTASANINGESIPSQPDNPIPRSARRGAKFNAGLSEPTSGTTSVSTPSTSSSRPKKYKASAPVKDDLTSTLIRDISTPPYPDCLICFAPIERTQQTWSCSPSLSSQGDSDNGDGAQFCWTIFHLHCIRSWAAKSVKEMADAWRARGEERVGEWRCPACRSERVTVPNRYKCFCGSTPGPTPSRLATPHSCGNTCSRRRACGHPCPLLCHPGPCPPCQVTNHLPCHCGKQTLSFKCSHLAPSKTATKPVADTDLSCRKICGRKLQCGNHECKETCHLGDCPPCEVRDAARCYCGKVEREVGCGEGEEKICILDGRDGQVVGEKWVGRFQCEMECERLFDCGLHSCSKPCHPPSASPPPCPRSPSLITHCPCGKHTISPSSAPFFPQAANLSRETCSDPIPTCTSTCMKPLSGCEHVCSAKCHTGPCPPCSIMLVRPCRCGTTTRNIKCAEVGSGAVDEILCDRACQALRACGRHQCNRLCCPLASLASTAKGKGKRRAGGTGVLDSTILDDTGLHECDLLCGKPLGCGSHFCEQRDHRGVCPPCLRSSFEEMTCFCGLTVLEPPIPCGTRISCVHPCSRPPPPCGHPRTQHTCHEDPSPCPPCPFLTNKQCACGKRTVPNVRCSQEKVSCGTSCGKLLACGFHHCEKLCHGDDCGPCASVCGKPRKLCLPAHHACTLPCHAPASCPESEPCSSIITLTCPCGRIRTPVKCGRTTANPAGREATQQLKCSNECNVAKRNARLAEALGIDPQSREKAVTYSDDLVAFARVNGKFLTLVEKTFAEFITSEKRTQVLPHMPMDRRRFVHDLAAVYRMDTQMMDQEPYRSVQLIRRVDTRVPPTLLSATITSSSAASLGKLADFRAPPTLAQPSRLSHSSSPTPNKVPAPKANTVSAATKVHLDTGSTPRIDRLPTPALPDRIAAETPTPPVDMSAQGVPENWEDDV